MIKLNKAQVFLYRIVMVSVKIFGKFIQNFKPLRDFQGMDDLLLLCPVRFSSNVQGRKQQEIFTFQNLLSTAM